MVAVLCDMPLTWTDVTVYALTLLFFCYVIGECFTAFNLRRK